MKKLVVMFLLIASALSFYTTYQQTDHAQMEQIEKLEHNIAKAFIIPQDLLLADPEEFYPLLSEVASELQVNIFRPSMNQKPNNEVELVKYVLLTSDTHFFEHVTMKSGRVFQPQDTQAGNLFLASTDTHDPNQIGVIKDFADNNLMTIKPLKTSAQYLPVEGRYFVEVPDDQAFHRFLDSFVNKLNTYYRKYSNKVSYTPQDFTAKPSETNADSTSSLTYVTYAQYAIFLVIVLFMIYYLFHESKRIGIFKMHGVSTIRLWSLIVGRMITMTFAFTVMVSLLLAAFVENTTFSFVYHTVIYQLQTYLTIIIVSLVSYIYIARITVNQIIKNRKDTNAIFGFNTLLKAVCSILLVFLGASLSDQYATISKKRENLKNWENSKDYGVFYPNFIGYDLEDVKQGSPRFFSVVNRDFYPLLNRMGSVLINARDYEEIALILNKDYQGIRSITVNNNYLKQFPLLDRRNQPIQVSENTTKWVLLVPDKYRQRETEIRHFFAEQRASDREYEQRFLKIAVPEHLQNQQVDIIWVANDQKVFSFNPEVFKTEHHLIIDPIVEVVTDGNSLVSDLGSVYGNGGTDPLKVKLINRDTALTYKRLEPELKRLKLDDNLKYLVTVEQFVLQEMYSLQQQMNQLLLVSLGLVVGLLVLVTQNLVVFFNKNQQTFIVHRLFGVGFFRTYRPYMLLFSVTWILQLLICFLVNRAFDLTLLAVATILIVVELIASVIALTTIERQNKIKVLKGGY